jgi:hypothetical protein
MTVRKFEKIANLTYPGADGSAATPANSGKASAATATRKPAAKPQDDDDVPF